MAFNTVKLHSTLGEFVFTDIDFVQGTVQDVMANSLIGVDLSIDEATFTIRSRKGSPTEWLYDENDEQIFDENDEPIEVNVMSYAAVDFSQMTPYKDEIEIWHGNKLEGRYYVASAKRIGSQGGWEVVGISAMGLIDRQEHLGGVYSAMPAGDIIAEIMGTIPYSIEAAVASTPVYGWLPYSKSARENLRDVLFACGASLVKDANGRASFVFLQPSTAIVKGVHDVYMGSSRDTLAPVTQVSLTEHTFFTSANVTADILYEDLTNVVTNYRIVFSKPYHSLVATGLTIVDSGENWAEISGTGTLKGKAYVHVERIKSRSTGVAGEPSEMAVTGATLVSQINSETVLERLVDYYVQKEEISAEVLTDALPGSMLRIPDPNNFSKTVTGYIKEASRTYSATVKSALKLTQGWTPKSFGNTYDSYLIVQRSDLSGGTWTVPTELRGKAALAVLFSGAQGGYGGYDGGAGERSVPLEPDHSEWYNRGFTGGAGGAGGAGAQGGSGGRYLSVNLASLASSYAASIGAGGAGGAHNGEAGLVGGDTTLGSYTTADGSLLDGFTYVNLIDQTEYGQPGGNGTAGKDGGRAGDFPRFGTPQDGQAGESYNSTWTGGAGGSALTTETTYGRAYSSGSGGGGGAYGRSGGDAYLSENERWTEAGPGANAVAPSQAEFYRGGDGGHGGGGGGGGGYELHRQGSYYTWEQVAGGAGGLGSPGGQGADGFILVYYKA